MDPNVFARAIVSIEQNYGLRLDARSAWLRMDAIACGRGWVGTKPGCKRGGKAESEPSISVPKIKTPQPEVLPDKSGGTIIKARTRAKKATAPKGKSQDKGIPSYTVKRTLGAGENGRADLTNRGTVVKTTTNSSISEAEVRREFDSVKHFHGLGLGPEAIGIKGKSIEIGLVEGIPLAKVKGEDNQMIAQMEAAKALLKLHKSGWAHNDAHGDNLIVQKDGSVKLIDAGQSVPVGAKIGSDYDGDFFGVSGVSDLQNAAGRHPSIVDLKRALKKDIEKHRKATTQSFGDMDEKEIYRIRQKAEIDLHKAYLAVADKYIK